MKHCRHYYVAVAAEDLKLSTLADLISALQARGPCAFAIVCSGRDVLDKLVTGLNQVKDLSVAYLHSDLDQAQRDLTVSQYLVRVSRQSTLPAENKSIASESQPADALSVQGTWAASAEVLVTTDVCLKAFEDEDHPALKLSLLVNYDLPTKKDLYARRIQVVCGTDDTTLTAAIAMYFVTAGQMAQLRAVEGFLGPAQLEIMPVHVADILQQTRQSVAAT